MKIALNKSLVTLNHAEKWSKTLSPQISVGSMIYTQSIGILGWKIA